MSDSANPPVSSCQVCNAPVPSEADACPSCGEKSWTLPRPIEPFGIPPGAGNVRPGEIQGMPQPAYGVPFTRDPIRMGFLVAFIGLPVVFSLLWFFT